jgi:hypothetical protein
VDAEYQPCPADSGSDGADSLHSSSLLSSGENWTIIAGFEVFENWETIAITMQTVV